MYSFNPSSNFIKKSKKLISKNKHLETKLEKVLDKLQHNPFSPSLKSHKVTTKHGVSAYSCRVTGDLRIIWDFNETEVLILDLIDIGGHSGNKSVY
jgi:mRNA interferase YafQ